MEGLVVCPGLSCPDLFGILSGIVSVFIFLFGSDCAAAPYPEVVVIALHEPRQPKRAAFVQENGWMQSTGRCGKAIELRWLLRETSSAPERSKRWPKMSRFNCTQNGKASGDFKLSPSRNSARRTGREACALPPATRPSCAPSAWFVAPASSPPWLGYLAPRAAGRHRPAMAMCANASVRKRCLNADQSAARRQFPGAVQG